MSQNQILFFCLLFAFQISISTSDGDFVAQNENKKQVLSQWCGQVPYPETCSLHLKQGIDRNVSVDRATFYRFTLHAALHRAVRARKHHRRMKNYYQGEDDHREWSDCEKLMANTVLQLNRTVLDHRDRTPYDFQTWLSAALTNIETCRTVFNFSRSLVKYRVSDVISNCLAINKPLVTTVNPTIPTIFRRNLAVEEADIVVAKDNSGNFDTVTAAVEAAGKRGRTGGGRLVIYVKTGVYTESIVIPSGLRDVTLVGDGKGKTIITNDRSGKNGYTMITSATLGVFGDGFIARDLTIRNTYGPGSQAVAFLLASDRSVVYRCSIEGYQDTLCVFSQRQFYRECDIYGTIDFIFGNAAVVIQNSNIYARKPNKGEGNVITAQARSDPNQNTGIVVQFSNIVSSAEFWPVHRVVKTYLGRPWMKYSRVVFLQNYISSIIDPEGWSPWTGTFALDTLYYAEYKNTGPGSRMSLRVKWPGYHVIGKASYVSKFTVNKFIAGDMWIPATSTPFAGGFRLTD